MAQQSRQTVGRMQPIFSSPDHNNKLFICSQALGSGQECRRGAKVVGRGESWLVLPTCSYGCGGEVRVGDKGFV